MSKLSILISFSGDGGVEKMMINLLNGLIEKNIQIDLLIIKSCEPYYSQIPSQVNILKLGSTHAALCHTALEKYIREIQPEVLLTAKHRALILALQVKKRCNSNTRIIGQLHSHASSSLKQKNWIKRILWKATMRKFYPLANKIISVSQGVADDIASITHLPTEKLPVIYNPVITPELITLANQPVDHPWFQEKNTPILLGAGRFTPQKDFPTLIHAFAKVRQARPCRLIIIGKGPLKSEYQRLIKELNIESDVSIPGFTSNPFAYMSKVDQFILSSAWEGFGLVLAEALAVGTPVCSCDCDSGPREILENGKYGRLVPVGDIDELANAINHTLDHPMDKQHLKQATQRFTIDYCTQQYMDTLFE